MKFIDEAIIEVKAGDGGNGCVSFRREKYVPRGGPDGGDGGAGGSCIVRSKAGITTLMDLKYRKRFEAKRGGHGKGKNMFGAAGEDVVITVPVGTLLKDAVTQRVLRDFIKPGEEFVVARGGKRGHGNTHYTTATRQAPDFAQKGTPGEERKILLELKLLADVGLIGFPNAGKSTLISAISNARPKIADYPFTTKVPHLGVVRLDREKSFVVADIPGLIEGAHEGAGMGVQFLKHIERTQVLLHLIDMTDPEHGDPWEQYEAIRAELKAYRGDFIGAGKAPSREIRSLCDKPGIVVLTKMDLPEALEKKKETEALFKKRKKRVLSISAAKREGLKTLIEKMAELLVV